MTKIQVPEGMLKAAYPFGKSLEVDDVEAVLQAALQWLSENPIVPTLPQLRAAEMAAAHEPMNSTRWLSDVLEEFQRRMFLAEPEVPEEIKDLLMPSHIDLVGRPDMGLPGSAEINQRIIEAFRRGQRSKGSA